MARALLLLTICLSILLLSQVEGRAKKSGQSAVRESKGVKHHRSQHVSSGSLEPRRETRVGHKRPGQLRSLKQARGPPVAEVVSIEEAEALYAEGIEEEAQFERLQTTEHEEPEEFILVHQSAHHETEEEAQHSQVEAVEDASNEVEEVHEEIEVNQPRSSHKIFQSLHRPRQGNDQGHVKSYSYTVKKVGCRNSTAPIVVEVEKTENSKQSHSTLQFSKSAQSPPKSYSAQSGTSRTQQSNSRVHQSSSRAHQSSSMSKQQGSRVSQSGSISGQSSSNGHQKSSSAQQTSSVARQHGSRVHQSSSRVQQSSSMNGESSSSGSKVHQTSSTVHQSSYNEHQSGHKGRQSSSSVHQSAVSVDYDENEVVDTVDEQVHSTAEEISIEDDVPVVESLSEDDAQEVEGVVEITDAPDEVDDRAHKIQVDEEDEEEDSIEEASVHSSFVESEVDEVVDATGETDEDFAVDGATSIRKSVTRYETKTESSSGKAPVVEHHEVTETEEIQPTSRKTSKSSKTINSSRYSSTKNKSGPVVQESRTETAQSSDGKVRKTVTKYETKKASSGEAPVVERHVVTETEEFAPGSHKTSKSSVHSSSSSSFIAYDSDDRDGQQQSVEDVEVDAAEEDSQVNEVVLTNDSDEVELTETVQIEETEVTSELEEAESQSELEESSQSIAEETEVKAELEEAESQSELEESSQSIAEEHADNEESEAASSSSSENQSELEESSRSIAEESVQTTAFVEHKSHADNEESEVASSSSTDEVTVIKSESSGHVNHSHSRNEKYYACLSFAESSEFNLFISLSKLSGFHSKITSSGRIVADESQSKESSDAHLVDSSVLLQSQSPKYSKIYTQSIQASQSSNNYFRPAEPPNQFFQQLPNPSPLGNQQFLFPSSNNQQLPLAVVAYPASKSYKVLLPEQISNFDPRFFQQRPATQQLNVGSNNQQVPLVLTDSAGKAYQVVPLDQRPNPSPTVRQVNVESSNQQLPAASAETLTVVSQASLAEPSFVQEVPKPSLSQSESSEFESSNIQQLSLAPVESVVSFSGQANAPEESLQVSESQQSIVESADNQPMPYAPVESPKPSRHSLMSLLQSPSFIGSFRQQTSNGDSEIASLHSETIQRRAPKPEPISLRSIDRTEVPAPEVVPEVAPIDSQRSESSVNQNYFMLYTCGHRYICPEGIRGLCRPGELLTYHTRPRAELSCPGEPSLWAMGCYPTQTSADEQHSLLVGHCEKKVEAQDYNPDGSYTCSNPNYVMVDGSNACYRAFSRGPCAPDEWLEPNRLNMQYASCQVSPCPHLADGRHIYWDEYGAPGCYRSNTRGPCRRGMIFVIEDLKTRQARCIRRQLFHLLRSNDKAVYVPRHSKSGYMSYYRRQ